MRVVGAFRGIRAAAYWRLLTAKNSCGRMCNGVRSAWISGRNVPQISSPVKHKATTCGSTCAKFSRQTPDSGSATAASESVRHDAQPPKVAPETGPKTRTFTLVFLYLRLLCSKLSKQFLTRKRYTYTYSAKFDRRLVASAVSPIFINKQCARGKS